MAVETKARRLHQKTRMAKSCPCCGDSEETAFPLYWLGDIEGCEGCLEDDQDAREFNRQNARDWD